ncbi:MAG: hypothetical protein HY719_09210 [Planctomycetes bacterium]|nr:hypothetical protein [Planctomycetota bacterium]
MRESLAGAQIIVDGSFVMAGVDEPGDIDVILVLSPDWDFSRDVSPSDYNLIAKKRVIGKYEIHLFSVRAGSEEERRWVEYFEQVGTKWIKGLGIPEGTRKGLVKVAS